MQAKKFAQIADSRKYLRRDAGALTYRRTKRKQRKLRVKRDKTSRRPLFLIMLFCISQYFFMKSSLFAHRELEIDGADSLSDSKIESKLGLQEGSSYWQLSPLELEENLSHIHQLSDAKVEVDFPGRIKVQVQERQPEFSVAFRKDTKNWFSVDDSGRLLEKATPPKEQLKFLLSHQVKGGLQVREQDMQVVRFFQSQLGPELAKDLKAINISNDRNIALKVMFGSRPLWIRLGRPEKLEYKLFLLGELRNHLGPKKSLVKAVDLRYSTPIVRLKKEQKSRTD